MSVILLLLASPASAALTHPIALQFSAGSDCTEVEDLAVHDSDGLLYVGCEYFNGTETNRYIERFDLNGNPVNFSASEPYLNGNRIEYTPGTPSGQIGASILELAVDNSSGPNDGNLYFIGNQVGSNPVQVFAPSGEWLTQIGSLFGAGTSPDGVDVGANGNLYTANGANFQGTIREFNPAFQETRRMLIPSRPYFLRVDSTGAIWSAGHEFSIPTLRELRKYEANQFQSNLNVGNQKQAEEFGVPFASPSPFAPDPLISAAEGGNGLGGFDVDPTNDDLLVNLGNKVVPYSPGSAEDPAHQNGPSFGEGTLSQSQGLTVDAGRDVFVGNGNKIVKFGPGLIVPDVLTRAPQIDDIGHTSVAVSGHVSLAGGPPVTSCQIQYGLDTTYSGPGSGTVPCTPDGEGEVSASIPGANPPLTTGSTYHYRLAAGNVNGTNYGVDRAVTPAAVIDLHTTAATDLEPHGATLNGTFDPDSIETFYRFEYGLNTKYGTATPEVNAGSDSGTYLATAPIEDLPSGKTIHYRLVARNGLGTTYGTDLTFRTPSPPEVSGARATEVTGHSAMLNAQINPVGYDTTYRFEYGVTTALGSTVPIPDADIGSGAAAEAVSQPISNLLGGVTYYFRVVAENQWGTTLSDITTFDFSPPGCPNAHVRQQTHASYLPDCRAYELVSPPEAKNLIIFPSGSALGYLQEGGESHWLWPQNTGRATSPSRFAYFGGEGALPEYDVPNIFMDMYMGTRTSTGWTTSYPGVRGSQALAPGRKRCSESLDICLDHNGGDGFVLQPPGAENPPYLFDADGSSIGRLPTNLAETPNGSSFVGDERPSADFSHYAFSSRNVSFAPGGLTEVPGSAYDNDIAGKTVSLISKTPAGQIPQDVSGNSGEYIRFPGISADGSHILMSVAGVGGPTHLYMRVNDAVTYDVSRGAGVKFVGMTQAGSEVTFIAAQQLTLDDTDDSADLYMWNEAGGADTLTLISQGNGQGNTDECSPDWTSQCDVTPLVTERGNPHSMLSAPGLDNYIAEESGDVYFYSPELLDPDNPGLANARNLYVYRDGAVHLVATFDEGTEVYRIQIAPDGRHAAFLTAAHLTGYDNGAFREMYTYEPETGAIKCASCRPDGLAPTAHTLASQGGPFMANDGRAFFATRQSLVPQDVDGQIIDVYEFVGGRPQLISSGTGSRDVGSGSSFLETLFPSENTGLEAVSANGVDVYFSTYDSLTPQDHNGSFVKIYDARTGGGFEPSGDFAPCVAADECHGAENPAPGSPSVATAAGLSGGNVVNAPARRCKRVARHRRGHSRTGTTRRPKAKACRNRAGRPR